jgi:hypothetical protein
MTKAQQNEITAAKMSLLEDLSDVSIIADKRVYVYNPDSLDCFAAHVMRSGRKDLGTASERAVRALISDGVLVLDYVVDEFARVYKLSDNGAF